LKGELAVLEKEKKKEEEKRQATVVEVATSLTPSLLKNV
jgi:hypothetical protein